MPAPAPPVRIRALSMELVARRDESGMDILVTGNDGSTITIECESDVMLAVAPLIAQIAQVKPEAVVGTRTTENQNDVIERIKAQRENVDSRRIFEDLFDNSDAAIIDHDFSALFRAVQKIKHDGVVDFRGYIAESDQRRDKLVDVVGVNNANAAALRILGAASLQDIDKQSTNIVDIAEAMFLGEPRIRRSEYLVAGGTPIPVVYSLQIPRTEEEAKRVPIVIMDLSDIRLAEAARQSSLAKSEFLSSMSHEIRTPLNGVIGNLELLALTSLDAAQLELIFDADKAAKALLGLVGNILDFSKIEAGKLTIETGDLNPAALVEEAVDVLQSLGRQKQIFVVATFGPDVPSLVRGDATRIRQILLNLIGNAVKFTDHGGVQVKLTVAAWDYETCELRFAVHDSGRGFNQILAAKLFEPFTQDRGATDRVEGTGLGLSICKSLVGAFGGSIGCESAPGEGASFWFTIPMIVVRRAPALARPDLQGVTAIVIGSGGVAKSLEEYFRVRGATVDIKDRTDPVFAAGQLAVGAPAADVAVFVPGTDDDDASGMAEQLRKYSVVPLVIGDAHLPRRWLRQGFAAVIPQGNSADYLDRNVRLLVGQADISDRMAAQQEAVISAFGSGFSGKTILVLEDRLVNQTVIQKQLERLGVDCVLAANGIKGLEAREQRHFDLILCDCSMPEMNGYDFTRVLRERESHQEGFGRVPVIALTANAFREDAEKCFLAGMDDFISKPVTMERLAAMLAKWLGPATTAEDRPLPTQVSARPAIDRDALAEILGTNEPELLNQILGEFLAVVRSSLSDVELAALSRDPVKIRAAAHNAKGEARCAAAGGLAELYEGLELRANDSDRAVSAWLVACAASEVHRVEGYIQGRLGVPA